MTHAEQLPPESVAKGIFREIRIEHNPATGDVRPHLRMRPWVKVSALANVGLALLTGNMLGWAYLSQEKSNNTVIKSPTVRIPEPAGEYTIQDVIALVPQVEIYRETYSQPFPEAMSFDYKAATQTGYLAVTASGKPVELGKPSSFIIQDKEDVARVGMLVLGASVLFGCAWEKLRCSAR